MTSVQVYGKWCRDTREEIVDHLPDELTWGYFRKLNEEMIEAYKDGDPPLELQAYHDHVAAGWADLIEMVDFTYGAENLEGVPLGINEDTVVVGDDLLAAVILFAFEKVALNEPPRLDPWQDLPVSIQEELTISGCLTGAQALFREGGP